MIFNYQLIKLLIIYLKIETSVFFLNEKAQSSRIQFRKLDKIKNQISLIIFF